MGRVDMNFVHICTKFSKLKKEMTALEKKGKYLNADNL